ncbi:MAG: glycosyltransferase, partial [Planctomycetota bacterium]
MRILACHNYYRYRGGEDLSFEDDVRMLRDAGHEVVTYTRDSRNIADGLTGRIRTATQLLYSRSAAREVADLIRRHNAEVLHANNVFPLISHSIFDVARAHGVASVRGLHSYRMLCANAFLYRDQSVCRRCLNQSAAWSAIRFGCYRDSRIASAAIVAGQLADRRQRQTGGGADVYFTPSEFARKVHVDGGLPASNVFVKPNFVEPDSGPGDGGNDFLFVGRLSQEKGLDTLLDCWKKNQWSHVLRIVGTGPLEESLRRQTAPDQRIQIIGQIEPDQVLEYMGTARCLIMPSRWYETFGRTIAESFSCGTPVIASNLGAMKELVSHGENGWLFDAGDVDSLSQQIQIAISKTDALETNRSLRSAARQTYTQNYTRQASLQALEQIYAAAKTQSAI